jgi:RND family efflux transporter MFP subunit
MRSTTALVATAVVVVAMLLLSGAFRKDAIRPQARELPAPATIPATALVERQNLAHEAEVVGTIDAATRTTVAARVIANIKKIHKGAGADVNEGDPLIDLDDTDLKARLAQANAAQKSAEASRKLAQVQRDSKKEQYDRNAATKLEYDEAQARYEVADAEVERARQLVREADIALAYASIKAPYRGRIIDVLAKEGDQASPGKPLLTMYDPKHLRLEAAVREAYIGYAARGDKVAVRIDAVRDPSRRERRGVIDQIVPAADPASRTILVKVALDEANAEGLIPGMFGRMTLKLDERPRLLIPSAAVEQVGQLTLVRVVEHGRPGTRAVRLGEVLVEQAKVEVLAGLSAGETVVVRVHR